MNVIKLSQGQIGHVCAHLSRSVKPGHYSNQDINENKTNLNYNLCKAERPKQVEYIKSKLNEISHSKRKDLVCMCSIVLDAPQSLPENLHAAFFETAYDFFVERYGTIAGFQNHEDIVISCYRHRDETTDHIHFAFLPIISNNGEQRFCAKEVVCRRDLQNLHKDLDKYLREHGIRAEILNGKTKKDSMGRAYSVKELKRMERNLERNRSYERKRF